MPFPWHRRPVSHVLQKSLVELRKPQTSSNRKKGMFVKQDFRYVADEDAYVCPAGERLIWRYVTEEGGLVVSRYWTDACGSCALKEQCTTGSERRISRWEHEHLVEDVQRRLDENPEAMRQRRETVEQPNRPFRPMLVPKSESAAGMGTDFQLQQNGTGTLVFNGQSCFLV